MDKADVKQIEKIKGVAGTNIAGSQLQVIIGTDVGNVCNEMKKLGNFEEKSSNLLFTILGSIYICEKI